MAINSEFMEIEIPDAQILEVFRDSVSGFVSLPTNDNQVN